MNDRVVAVLLPCYNEEATVGKVVTDMRHMLPYAEIYVYDNNSTDLTALAAKRAGAIVRRCPVQGKGAVVRQMFREIDADVYLMADGDDTYPAEEAHKLIDAVLEDGADMAVGDRLSTTYFRENTRRFHGFGNNLVRWAVRCLFGDVTKDVMTGYRAFSFVFAKTFPVMSNGFAVETEMTVHAADYRMRVVDVPITFRDRPEGSESKLSTIPDGIRVLCCIAKLFRDVRPMGFFGILSALSLTTCGAGLWPVLSEYIATGLVPRFPTLIASGFFGLAGLLFLSCGLVLSSLKNKDRRDFEFRLQEAAQWRKNS